MTTAGGVASGVRALGAMSALLIGIQACSLVSSHSEVLTAPDGFRTFTVIREIGGTPVLCPAFGLADPVHGTLDGSEGAREPIWMKGDAGRQLSVVWPAGFSVRFEPGASLYNEQGRRIGTVGDAIELSQTTWGSATGTFEDPYIAQGLVFGSCYPFVK